MFGRQDIGNHRVHVTIGKILQARNALLEAWDVTRVKIEEANKRGNVSGCHKGWPMLHKGVFRHCWAIAICADIVADKFHPIRAEKTLFER